MHLRYLILGGMAVLLGFLLYPRGEEATHQEFVKPLRRLDNEPLHYTDILRTTPIYTTYDLGYVYRIDKAEVRFENPHESGPKQYDLLVQTDRTEAPFLRAFSYVGNSREYTYSVQSFPVSVEARWLQIVINDWFSDRPNLETDTFRVGVRYETQNQFDSVTANYNNSENLKALTDLLPFKDSKWIGARRIEEEVKIDGNTERRTSYESPTDSVEVTVDLGMVSRIHGFRLTTDGPGNNLKRYRILISSDGRKYSEVYTSKILPDETITDLNLFNSLQATDFNSDSLQDRKPGYSGRYVRLQIDRGDWYGSYPELREFEIFTDTYRLPPLTRHELTDYNAVQMYYENLGENGNALAPHLVQGFAFDRDSRDETHYFLAADQVDGGNSPAQMSFAYHYDRVKLRYTGLDPSRLYWVQITYLQEKSGGRKQNLILDGFILHDAILVPEGRSATSTFAIPNEAYADSIIELDFNRLAGPNAVVSEVSILATRGPQELDLATGLYDRENARAIRVPTAPTSASRVVIDGTIDEWPQFFPLFPVNHDTKTETPTVVHAQWDDDNLYIAAVINRKVKLDDDEQRIAFEQTPSSLDKSEALHIFVDTALQRSPGMYTSNDHHFVFTVIDPHRDKPRVIPSQIHHHLDAIPSTIEHHRNIQAKVEPTKDGYTLEARIPSDLALSTFDPLVGQRIGFNYVMENLKLGNNRSVWLSYATNDLSAPPERWNVVQLVNQISGQAAIITKSRFGHQHENINFAEPHDYTSQSGTTFNAGDDLILCVWDAERNTNRYDSESIEIELRNETIGRSRTIVLYESSDATLMDNNPENDRAVDSSLFASTIETLYRANEEGGKTKELEGDKPMENRALPMLVDGMEVLSLTYIDPYFSTTQRNYPVKTFSMVNTGTTGTISIANRIGKSIEQFQLGTTIYIQVRDSDLDAVESEVVPEIEARLLVPETQEIEIVKLTYKSEKDCYEGAIATSYNQVAHPGDNVLQSVGTRPVSALYLDEIQDTGRTNVAIGATVRPTIGQTAQIKLKPITDLLAINDLSFFYAGDSISVWITDKDLNQNGSLRETVEVTLSGDVLKDEYKLTLTETTIASGEFTASCQTSYARSAAKNDVLEVRGKEVVTVSHLDLLQGSGETNVLVTANAHVKSGYDGTIKIVKANYITQRQNFNAGDILYIRLRDTDITDETVQITLVGDTLHDREVVDLTQAPSTTDARPHPEIGVFLGSIPTTYDLQKIEDDGRLQVEGSEQIQVVYIDKLRSTGEVSFETLTSCMANVGTTGSLRVYNKNKFDSNSNSNIEISKFRAGDTLILEIRDVDLDTGNSFVKIFETDSSENEYRDEIRVSMIAARGRSEILYGEVKTSYAETPIPIDDILQVQGGGIVNLTYLDSIQDTGATQVPITVKLSVQTGDKGKLEIYSAESAKLISGFSVGTGSFDAGERLRIQLIDKDLALSPEIIDTVTIAVSGNVVKDQVRLVLSETNINSATFVGKLETQRIKQPTTPDSTTVVGKTGNQAIGKEMESNSQFHSNKSPKTFLTTQHGRTNDKILQVVDKERIIVEYIDRLTATGEPHVAIQAKAIVLGSSAGLLRIVDKYGSGVQFSPHQELVSFDAGQLIYVRLEDLLLSTVVNTEEVQITLSGDKTQDTVNLILVKHPEAQGVFTNSVPTRYGTAAIADDTLDVQGGEEIRAFYNPPSPIVQAFGIADYTYVNHGIQGHLSIINQDGTILHNVNIGDSIYFRLEDGDLNLNPFTVESVDISVSKTDSQSTTQTPHATIVPLYEDGPNSHVFRGLVSTQYGQQKGNGIGLVGEEIVTATYEDSLISTGETNVETNVTCRAKPVARAQYTSQPVVIDGIDDKWPLEKVIRTSEDEGLLWLQWSDDSLYLLAQIYDNDVVVPNALTYYEGADALELHINLQPSGGSKPIYLQTVTDPNQHIFWICPKGAGFDGNEPYIGQWVPERIYNYEARNLDAAVRWESGYYVIEARIPFYPVLGSFDPIKTKRHNRLGFNFVIHRSNDRRVYWTEQTQGIESVAPSNLGMLILEERVVE